MERFGFLLVAFLAVAGVTLTWTVLSVQAWGSNKEKVLLKELSAITLEQGKRTTGRRSSSVQQLQCVGGSGGCSHGIQPRVVQCLNRGFDGYDVQWECKAELDSKYQFGKIQVSCEGYDYPDDPYVLRGSCGLEYELDLTQQGEDSRYHGNSHRNDYHHDNSYQGYNYQSGGRRSWSWGGLLALAVVAFVFYQILKACFGGGHHAGQAASATDSSYSGSQSSSAPRSSGTTGAGGGGGWGGFWSGAATGGALGYLFGNRGGAGRGYGGWGGGYGGYGGGYGPSWGGGYNRGYSSGGWSSGWSSPRRSGGGFGGGGGGSSRSSSSRSSSGFGGTSRR